MLRVSLLDVTEADRAATIVTAVAVPLTVLMMNPDTPPSFSLVADHLDDRRRYTVAAHADVDGSGKVCSGDQITVQSYPVLTFGNPAELQIALEKV
jgi:hypothetical protein